MRAIFLELQKQLETELLSALIWKNFEVLFPLKPKVDYVIDYVRLRFKLLFREDSTKIFNFIKIYCNNDSEAKLLLKYFQLMYIMQADN